MLNNQQIKKEKRKSSKIPKGSRMRRNRRNCRVIFSVLLIYAPSTRRWVSQPTERRIDRRRASR